MDTGDARVRAWAPGWAPRAAVAALARDGAWRTAAFGTLAVAATLDRYTFEVAGVSVKFEHMALGLAWALGIWAALTRGWRPPLGRFCPSAACSWSCSRHPWSTRPTGWSACATRP